MMPLIDQVHRLMHLWKAGDQVKVDQYLEDRGLRRSELFKQLLQALIELSPEGSEERSVLESLSNHVQARGIRTSETAPLPYAEIVEPEEEGGGDAETGRRGDAETVEGQAEESAT